MLTCQVLTLPLKLRNPQRKKREKTEGGGAAQVQSLTTKVLHSKPIINTVISVCTLNAGENLLTEFIVKAEKLDNRVITPAVSLAAFPQD